MNIMDTFRNAFGGNPAQQQTQQQPQQTSQGATPGNPGNLPANIPAMSLNSPDGQLPGTQPQKEVDPMGEFISLWDTPKPAEGAYVDAPIRFQVDAGKVNQSVKAVDFTKMVTPALMEKINAGGEGAMQAMVSAMNEIGQHVMAQTMMANTKVLESGLDLSHKRVEASLPGTIRKQTVSAALREDNPLFNNPAAAPMLQMLENQLIGQFPNATTAEIKDHARKFLSGFATSITKQEPETPQAASARGREIDWSNVPIQ